MSEDLIGNEVKCFTSESVDTSPPPFFQFVKSIILSLVVWSIRDLEQVSQKLVLVQLPLGKPVAHASYQYGVPSFSGGLW